MAVGAAQHRHLEEHGWCVVKSVVEPSVAVRACSLIDGILGGAHGEVVPRGVDEGGNGRYQTGGAWPAPSSRLPVVLSGTPSCTQSAILSWLSSPFRSSRSTPGCWAAPRGERDSDRVSASASASAGQPCWQRHPKPRRAPRSYTLPDACVDAIGSSSCCST